MNLLRLLMLLLASVSTIALVFTERIYDLDLRLYRKFGWTQLADRWEQKKSLWLPVSKAIIAGFLLSAIVILFFAGRNY